MSREGGRRRRGLAALVAAVAAAVLPSCGDDPTYFPVSHVESGDGRPRATDEEAIAGADAVRALAAQLLVGIDTAQGSGTWSPLALASALGMLRAGADGELAAGIDALLGATDGDDVGRSVGSIEEVVLGEGGPTAAEDGRLVRVDLRRATALWGRSGTTWAPAFLDELARTSGESMWMADWAQDPARATADVNDWVASRTAEQITDAVLPSALTADTGLAATSVLWFAAPWKHPMAARPDGLLHLDAELVHRQGPGWESVTLPYAGDDLALTVLVPDEDGGAPMVLLRDQLLPALATDVAAEPIPVRLALAPFELDTRLGSLEQVGVDVLGRPGAGLVPMADDAETAPEALEVLAHRALLRVGPAGTNVADGSVADALAEDPSFEPQRTMTAARDVAFVIHHLATGTPLFVGRVDEPATSD